MELGVKLFNVSFTSGFASPEPQPANRRGIQRADSAASRGVWCKGFLMGWFSFQVPELLVQWAGSRPVPSLLAAGPLRVNRRDTSVSRRRLNSVSNG